MTDNAQIVELTPKAAEFAKKLLEKEGINPPPGGIRFQIKAGGCHGLECVHTLERADAKLDMIILSNGIRILIDPKSAVVLKGTTIDHSENLLEKNFTYTNPNAKSSCGCGTSFELK